MLSRAKLEVISGTLTFPHKPTTVQRQEIEMNYQPLKNLMPGEQFRIHEGGNVFVRSDWGSREYSKCIEHRLLGGQYATIWRDGFAMVIPVYEKPTQQPESKMDLETHRRTILGAINLLRKGQYYCAVDSLGQLIGISDRGELGSVSHAGLQYAISEIHSMDDRTKAIQNDKARILGNLGRMGKALEEDAKKAAEPNYKVTVTYGLMGSVVHSQSHSDAMDEFSRAIRKGDTKMASVTKNGTTIAEYIATGLNK